MKTIASLVLVLLTFLIANSFGQSSYDVQSPDKRIEIRIRTAGQLRYDVVVKGRAVLENCNISLDVEHQKLGPDPKVMDAKTGSHDEMIKPVVRQKFAEIRDRYKD